MNFFTKEDATLLYIIKQAVQDLRTGTWSECHTIYNHLATIRRSEDGLKTKYRVMSKDRKTRRSVQKMMKETQWIATKQEVENYLLGNVRITYRV